MVLFINLCDVCEFVEVAETERLKLFHACVDIGFGVVFRNLWHTNHDIRPCFRKNLKIGDDALVASLRV